MIIATLVLVGTTVLATAWVTTPPALIGLRFVSGLGAGAMLASVATLASEFTPERYRALAVTAVTAGYPLGAMMTGLVANQVMPEHGWQGMFALGGTVTLVLAALAALTMPESLQFLSQRQPSGALDRINRTLQRLTGTQISALAAPEAAATSSANVLHKMRALLAPQFRRRTLILWAAFFLSISALYVLMSWIPKLLINAGFESAVSNRAFTIFNLGGGLGIIFLGWLAARLRLTTLITVFVAAAAFLMWLFASVLTAPITATTLLALVFVLGFTLQGGYTGLYAVAAKLYPIEIRSTGVGWAIGLGRFGAVIGPGLAGYMIAAEVPITLNLLTFAIPLLLSGILAYTLKIR